MTNLVRLLFFQANGIKKFNHKKKKLQAYISLCIVSEVTPECHICLQEKASGQTVGYFSRSIAR